MAKRTRTVRRTAARSERARRLRRTLEEILPAGVRGHLRQARREVLLAIRDVVDYAISRADSHGKPRRPRPVRVE